MKTVKHPRIVGMGVSLALLLAGCGTDLEDNTPVEPPPAPPEPTAPVAVEANLVPEQIKRLSIVWTDVEGATSYRVMGNPDGISGFTQIGSDIQPGVEYVTISNVPLTERLNAEYMVESCNDVGCTASDTVFTDETLDQAIGYVKAPNTDSDHEFGGTFKVSGDGQTMVVGLYNDESVATGINGDSADRSGADIGAVIVYRKINDQWEYEAYLKSPVPASDAEEFGQAVAVSDDGDTIAVGVPREQSLTTDPTDNTGFDPGAVHVFERLETGWEQTDYIKAEIIKNAAEFGTDVALSGDGNYLAISAIGDNSNSATINSGESDTSMPGAGSVHVYKKVLFGDFEREAYLKPSDVGTAYSFGTQIDLSFDGSVLVANSPGSDSSDGSVTDVGGVFVFKRSASTWTEDAYLRDPTGVSSDNFGEKLSLSADGTRLAISNPRDSSSSAGIGGDETDTSMSNAGSVYVYEDDGSAWAKIAFIKSEVPTAQNQFGKAIEMSADGSRLLVGETANGVDATGLRASPFDSTGKLSSGAVFDYSETGGVWSYDRFFKAPNAENGDFFGSAISMPDDESLVAVSAWLEDGDGTLFDGQQSDNDNPRSGAIYFY